VTLADRLAPLEPDDQGALARREAPDTGAAELIAAIRIPQLGEWARLHLQDALIKRGQDAIGPIVTALKDEPLAPRASTLGETLVQIYEDDASARDRSADGLIAGLDAALAAGAPRASLDGLMMKLGELEELSGPLPRAAPTAARFLAAAAVDPDGYRTAVQAALRLSAG
jgi:hypothetical protein